jgi:hypothetical protein
VRDPIHRNPIERREPNFDDVFKPPRRKRRPVRTGMLARLGPRGAADVLATLVVLVALGLVFVNALALQRVPAARASQPQRPAAPVVAPLPPPRPDVTGSIGTHPAAANPRVLSVQRLLARYGYGPLHASGAPDEETRAAITRFERDRELPPTGEISERLLNALAAFQGSALD